MSSDLVAVENRLWAAADQLWANTGLKPSEFSTPVLRLIFLRYADKRFAEVSRALDKKGVPADEREPMDYQAEGVLYLPEEARFSSLLKLTEGANLGKAVANAMALVEQHCARSRSVDPVDCCRLTHARAAQVFNVMRVPRAAGGSERDDYPGQSHAIVNMYEIGKNLREACYGAAHTTACRRARERISLPRR